MLEQAHDFLVTGHNVAVVAASQQEVNRLKRQIGEMGADPKDIRFISVQSQLNRLRGFQGKVFVDHFVWETAKDVDAWELEQLIAWCDPKEPSPLFTFRPF